MLHMRPQSQLRLQRLPIFTGPVVHEHSHTQVQWSHRRPLRRRRRKPMLHMRPQGQLRLQRRQIHTKPVDHELTCTQVQWVHQHLG